MNIGIISDTHGVVSAAQAAVPILRQADVSLLIHCGDIGGTEILNVFAEWPTHYVRGNVDRDASLYYDAAPKQNGTFHGDFGSVELEGVRIAFLHSHLAADFQEAKTSGEWNLVCYGHTHLARVQQVGKTTVLNPGALWRATPRTLAIVELPELKITHHEVPRAD